MPEYIVKLKPGLWISGLSGGGTSVKDVARRFTTIQRAEEELCQARKREPFPNAEIETGEQPDGPTGTEARVCQDIARRQQLGIRKYGTTVEDNPIPFKEWVRHAYEEVLDLAVYLRRMMDEDKSLYAAIKRGGLDLSPCRICGETVACLPEGLTYCEECARKHLE